MLLVLCVQTSQHGRDDWPGWLFVGFHGFHAPFMCPFSTACDAGTLQSCAADSQGEDKQGCQQVLQPVVIAWFLHGTLNFRANTLHCLKRSWPCCWYCSTPQANVPDSAARMGMMHGKSELQAMTKTRLKRETEHARNTCKNVIQSTCTNVVQGLWCQNLL